jgi:hypothetical protein
MKKIRYKLFITIIYISALPLMAQPDLNTYKPWTYWWWMGSAVNRTEIARQLDDFSQAGLGGVHIIPIYGVKGYEDQFLPFLSEEWMHMVEFTIAKAGELNLGVDLTLGTGWPYGGSWIDKENAAKKLMIKVYQLKQVKAVEFRPDSIRTNNGWIALFAAFVSNDAGKIINLTSRIGDAAINQEVPPSNWKLTCFGIANTGQWVKRAAPGDEGLVIDYFDRSSLNKYLKHFDSVFSVTAHPIHPRAFYHDSYEVYQANWTLKFLSQFRKLRGYDLSDNLFCLTDSLSPERSFILHDIRETFSDLLYGEFTLPWNQWCRNRNTVTRNQAHGSPANILDLYALSDIPETESFGCSSFSIPGRHCDPDYEETRFGRPSPLIMKFASSPAHLFNKPLVSSETGTWLANHFKVSLAQLKPQIDELLVSGINHIFYHGITYSPDLENFPGFLFYASTNFGETSHFWNELPLLNEYIKECQRLLQNTTPDNNILLYFPLHDLWSKYPGDLLVPLDVHNYSDWFDKTAFGETAMLLWNQGFTFDYISDRQLMELTVKPGNVISAPGGAAYSLIIVPSSDYLDQETLMQLNGLAQKGAKIIFVDRLPQRPSGLLAQSEPMIKEFQGFRDHLPANKNVKVSEDLISDLNHFPVVREEIKSKGLDFIRKRTDSGYLYFITNLGDRFHEDSICLSVKYDYITRIDPLTLKEGYLKSSGKFYLQLPPGKSCFIKTSMQKPDAGAWSRSWNKDTTCLNNSWTVNFISTDHQSLKMEYRVDSLISWTEWGDEYLRSFCGKAKYTSGFTLKRAPLKEESYLLVFDTVHETAAITINGTYCGTIWSLPYHLEIPGGVLKRDNTISITVRNLSANRIKSMDAQGIYWKKFYDINLVDIQYKPFDASNWKLTPSGIEGKVMLIRQ